MNQLIKINQLLILVLTLVVFPPLLGADQPHPSDQDQNKSLVQPEWRTESKSANFLGWASLLDSSISPIKKETLAIGIESGLAFYNQSYMNSLKFNYVLFPLAQSWKVYDDAGPFSMPQQFYLSDTNYFTILRDTPLQGLLVQAGIGIDVGAFLNFSDYGNTLNWINFSSSINAGLQGRYDFEFCLGKRFEASLEFELLSSILSLVNRYPYGSYIQIDSFDLLSLVDYWFSDLLIASIPQYWQAHAQIGASIKLKNTDLPRFIIAYRYDMLNKWAGSYQTVQSGSSSLYIGFSLLRKKMSEMGECCTNEKK
jgi:hypothetical protein